MANLYRVLNCSSETFVPSTHSAEPTCVSNAEVIPEA